MISKMDPALRKKEATKTTDRIAVTSLLCSGALKMNRLEVGV